MKAWFVGVAIALWAPSARADDLVFIGSGVAQAGALVETHPKGTPDITDFHADAIPQAALRWFRPTQTLTLSYQLTAALHSAYASELGQHAALEYNKQFSERTTFLSGVSASRMTLNNLFLTQPTATAVPSLNPNTSTTFVDVEVHQGLLHELTRNIRVDEEVTASAYKALAPAPALTSLYGSAGGGIERVWTNDGIGLQALVADQRQKAAPPQVSDNLLVVSGGPRWRRDWSQNWNTLLTAGFAVVKSTENGSAPYLAPTARAQFLYQTESSQLSGALSTGVAPNPLTGQITQSHTVEFHAVTPISLPLRLFLETSAAFTRGKLIDRVHPAENTDYNTFIAGASVIWETGDHLQVFGTYTFTGQTGEGTSPAVSLGQQFIRNQVVVGITVSTDILASRGQRKAGGANGVPSAMPQRVDRADQIAPPKQEDRPEPNAPPPLYDRDKDDDDDR